MDITGLRILPVDNNSRSFVTKVVFLKNLLPWWVEVLHRRLHKGVIIVSVPSLYSFTIFLWSSSIATCMLNLQGSILNRLGQCQLNRVHQSWKGRSSLTGNITSAFTWSPRESRKPYSFTRLETWSNRKILGNVAFGNLCWLEHWSEWVAPQPGKVEQCHSW